MEFRQAKQDDLLPLLRMYEKIIQKMNAEAIPIWDDVYPCAYFAGDIEKGRFLSHRKGTRLQRDLLCAIPTTGRMQWIGQSRRPAPVIWIVWGSARSTPGREWEDRCFLTQWLLPDKKGRRICAFSWWTATCRRSVCTERAGLSRLAAFMKSRSTRIFRCGNTDLRSGFCQ